MKILLPLDGSEPALEAVQWALRVIANGLQAELVLANVQEPTHLYEVVLAHDAELLERASIEAGEHALQSGEALLSAAGVACERVVASGDPAHKIIDIAEHQQCDLILLVARDAGSLRGALLGSVSDAVLRSSSVPVTIVKAAEAVDIEPGAPDENGEIGDG